MARIRVKEAISRHQPNDIVQFVKHLPDFVKLFFRLLADRRVGWFAKAILLGALVYVVSPLDFLPDLAPVIGQLDDLSLFLLAARMFISMVPQPVIQEHVARIDQSGAWAPFGTRDA